MQNFYYHSKTVIIMGIDFRVIETIADHANDSDINLFVDRY